MLFLTAQQGLYSTAKTYCMALSTCKNFGKCSLALGAGREDRVGEHLAELYHIYRGIPNL